jgi:hypothetical protein
MSTSTPNTFLDRPPVLYVWRPFYRRIVTPLILPVLGALRAYFSAPFERRTAALEQELALLRSEVAQARSTLEAIHAAIPGIHNKVDETYLDSLRQWSALEHVVVSSLRLADRSAVKRYDLLNDVAKEQRANALRNEESWAELERLVMSLLAQPSVRTTSASGSDR